MTRKITNISESKHKKLLHISKLENRDFNSLEKRYLQERFLYRLSISEFKNKFILKGGLLLVSIDIPFARPTMDIDFLAQQISRNNDNLKHIFQKICEIPLNDGIIFDHNTITLEEIDKDGDYNGVRVKLMALMGTRKTLVSFDLGFSDKTFPKPREIMFPTILNEEPPQLFAYCLETIVAEKFEAMVKLALLNSRMKDFYDVYMILTTQNVNYSILSKSITTTFGQRKTKLTKRPLCFTASFYKNAEKQKQWQGFLKKNNITNVPNDFSEIVVGIKSILLKII